MLEADSRLFGWEYESFNSPDVWYSIAVTPSFSYDYLSYASLHRQVFISSMCLRIACKDQKRRKQ
ncbi:hypothetical protein ccbrp13_57380 [Ktedonobacteria bacterium brp13]|nr:hypothetical protein ccbrp13_57380 [Ktedonobacteria bacterium brp13]